MPTFATTRDAKEYLIGRIVAESELDDIPLSELETKMLYFSETDWSLPDIYEVYEAFELEYDSAEYEEKIASLIRKLRVRASNDVPREVQRWNEAIKLLKKEDHYLLVLIRIADGTLNPISNEAEPSATSLRRFVLIGLAIGCLLLSGIYAALRIYANLAR